MVKIHQVFATGLLTETKHEFITDPESQQEGMQGHNRRAEAPKMLIVTPSAGKVMATVFWDSKEILQIEYTGKGSITAPSYANSLCYLKEESRSCHSCCVRLGF